MFLSAIYPSPQLEYSLTRTAMEQNPNTVEADIGEIRNPCETISSVRSRRRISELSCCPVCSCTLRMGELQAHLTLELDRLAKLTCPPPKRRAGTPSTSQNGISTNNDVDVASCTGNDVYERVKKNREKRLRSNRGRNEIVTCPVCNRRLNATGAEAHVDACLRKSTRTEDDDESIDVEGDDAPDEENEDDRFGVSYEWCSQVRVRASALQLLDGGELPHGAMRIRRASTDTHLVVDADDDDLVYGPPQYSPSRIIPQNQSNTNADTDNTIISESSNDESRVEGDSYLMNDIHMESANSINVMKSDTEEDSDPTTCYNIVLEALKSRIRELEQQLGSKNKRSEIKCLICIGPYMEPVVSVQCWHVYCEACWLASLSAKKTCPQCNTITTSQHLRRIYL